jgi:hypothetical protein
MRAVAALLLALASTTASGGGVVRLAPVPALDEAGLVLLAVVVGGVASWAVKRRRDRR